MPPEISIELVLAVWGAVVATIIAIFEIQKEYRQRPKIKVDATLSFRSCEEQGELRGVRLKVQRGPDIMTEEALVLVTIRNFGRQPNQICAVYVETENNVTQIIPTPLPAILDPNTSVTAEAQPEWFAPQILDETPHQPAELLWVKVVSIGALDALGKKHSISKENLKTLAQACEKLPLRIGVFKNKRTGYFISAFQTKDRSVLVQK